MAALTSELNQHKLETEFGDGYVVHSTKQHKVLSTWKHQKEIGAGGFGSVSLQEDSGGQLRAIKRLPRNPKPLIDFTRELSALIKLKDVGAPRTGISTTIGLQSAQHDHLFVKFFGWYENDTDIFLAMEYIQYGDLSEYIKVSGRAKAEAKEITRQILKGLEILHGEGICHRDLKPQVPPPNSH